MPKSMNAWRVSLLFFVLLTLTGVLSAQSLTSGDIAGTVTDPSGAGVPNATITATNRGTQAVQTTTTNTQGAYHFAFLPPGQYELAAKAAGFADQTRITNVQVGQATTVNVQMSLAAATQTVEVSESYGVVQSQTADITTNISTQQLTN